MHFIDVRPFIRLGPYKNLQAVRLFWFNVLIIDTFAFCGWSCLYVLKSKPTGNFWVAFPSFTLYLFAWPFWAMLPLHSGYKVNAIWPLRFQNANPGLILAVWRPCTMVILGNWWVEWSIQWLGSASNCKLGPVSSYLLKAMALINSCLRCHLSHVENHYTKPWVWTLLHPPLYREQFWVLQEPNSWSPDSGSAAGLRQAEGLDQAHFTLSVRFPASAAYCFLPLICHCYGSGVWVGRDLQHITQRTIIFKHRPKPAFFSI